MRTLQTYAALVLLSLTLTALIFSCEKDIFHDETGGLRLPDEPPPPAVAFSSNDSDDKNDGPRRTELGALRQNPYTVENLAAAMNELYGTQLERVPTTHLYLKFTPATNDDLRALEAYDLDLFDFPLEREVLELGDYYFEPVGKDDLPEYWTVVAADAQLPNVPHELVAEVNLTESDPFLMRAAFTRTGNEAEIDQRFPLPPGLSVEDMNTGMTDCQPGCPSWPCCLSDLLDCADDYLPDWCLDFDPECYPGLPDYPECLEGDPGDGPTLNDCGCVLSANPRFPGGCVRVMDSELGYEGVAGVKVLAWDGWLRISGAYTNENGCWRINRSFRGNGRFWVKFKNRNGTSIRGARDGSPFWEHLTTITDYVGSVAGPNFNNITISYDLWNEQGSQAHRYWSAASVLNRVANFDELAEQRGIATAPGLDIYVALNRQGGAALMTSQMDLGSLGMIVAGGIAGSNHFGDYPLFNILAAGTAGLTAESLRQFVPDMVIGTNTQQSDRLASVAFHELGHAAMFGRIGNDYWRDLCIAEIVAENQTGHPWGDAGSNDAGLISVMESWAEHVGHSFTHEHYGTQNNIGYPTYVNRLERTRNFNEAHIPIGIYQDLADFSSIEPQSFDQEGPWSGYVNDLVGQVTMGDIFSVIDAQVTDTELLRQRIQSGIVGNDPTAAAAVNDLFDSY